MLFHRIFNNQLYGENVDALGWNTNGEVCYPPDEYFDRGEFVIHRGCYSIGDWGILTAMPRLLKEHYPDCKVFVTSDTFAERLYGSSNVNSQNVWGIWADPYANIKHVFGNNPYVDEFIDEYDGEIYHDHFRIRNHLYKNDPLVLQMLRFHKVPVDLESDYVPEIYFSSEEIEQFEEFKVKTFGDSDYGSISYRYVNEREGQPERLQWVQDKLDEYKDLPFMYYCNFDGDFEFNKILDADGLDVRLLLYLICNAKVCVGLQSGIYDTCGRYVDINVLAGASNVEELNEHFLPSIDYKFIDKEIV